MLSEAQLPSPLESVRASSRVLLLGLDFGSTTSSALIAEARVGNNCQTGRMEFGEPAIIFRSDPVFTPFAGEDIDEAAIRHLLDAWFAASGVAAADIFAGGTLITGLAARQKNAAALAQLVAAQIGESVVAAADDPCLESWLAFMGSCSTLSRFHAARPLLNLDIGGGTTNPALGINGNVLDTGCYFVGARHFQFQPGSYQLSAISRYGTALLDALGIARQIGDHLSLDERQAILAFYIAALEAMVLGTPFFTDGAGQAIEQVRFCSAHAPGALLTFSGGVGELVYRYAVGETLPGTTYFGDFGIDLARAIAASPVLSKDLAACIPENRGRATVYGLTLHCTEVSGATLFLPKTDQLPLRDLPIIARIPVDAEANEIIGALTLARSARRGACIQLINADNLCFGLDEVRRLGQCFATCLEVAALPADQMLVLLIEANAGKTLGHYATHWGKSGTNLIVIDEIRLRNAHFVNIGRLHRQIVPIAFFGMH